MENTAIKMANSNRSSSAGPWDRFTVPDATRMIHIAGKLRHRRRCVNASGGIAGGENFVLGTIARMYSLERQGWQPVTLAGPMIMS